MCWRRCLRNIQNREINYNCNRLNTFPSSQETKVVYISYSTVKADY